MSDQPAELPDDTATKVFAGHRELLFSVVYSMIGSVSDTEDVLQDTWLAWVQDGGRRPAGDDGDNGRGRNGRNVGSDLLRTAIARALARQSRITQRRAACTGPWLPEPTATGAPPDAPAAAPETGDTSWPELRTESASMALLVVMETLPPLERAVFVLNEVFGYPHTDIARILGRHPGTVRQLAHRAREHVRARRPHYPPDPRLQQRLTERFIAAAVSGDLAVLLQLLAPDVTMWTDGGGKARSALRPVSGRERVAGLLSAYAASRPPKGLDVRYRHVNGDPSAVVFSGDSPYAVLVMDLSAPGDQVAGIYLVTKPDQPSPVAGHLHPDGEG